MKQFFFGTILILLSALIASIFTSLGWFIPAMFLVTLIGLIPLFKSDNFFVGFGTLLIVAAVGMIICSMQEYSILPGSTAAARTDLSDKKIVMEYEGSAPIIHQFWKAGSEYAGTAHVAPAVSSDWKKEDPISVWVISDTAAGNTSSALRLVGLSRYDYLDAITNAEKKYAVHSVEDVAIVRPINDPASVYRKMYLNGLFITGSGILALLLMQAGVYTYNKFKK